MGVQKFFISYHRSAENDRWLAYYLKTGLEAAGYQAFIDIDMPVGTKWAARIAREIAEADCFVVLISKQSIASEMVQAEVRKAHHAKRGDGRPIILPIRVAYDGVLDTELDGYLSPLQHVTWDGRDDSERVLNDLLRAMSIDESNKDKASPKVEVKTELDAQPPKPVSDRQALFRVPGGTTRIDDPFYINRPADRIIEVVASQIGETILIKAPQQTGGSSLLMRYLARCREAGKHIVYLDFQSFTNADLNDYPVFLQRIAGQIQRGVDLDDPDITSIVSQLDFIHFIDDHVLKKLDGPVTFAFDEVDRILGQPYQSDFFSMLRTWHNNRANYRSSWVEVDLALVIATEPYLLIKDGNQSPFNIALPIVLEPFEEYAVTELNIRYDSPLGDDQLSQLYKLLAGHPYLTRLAFFRVVSERRPFDEISRDAHCVDGPFGDHLRAMLMHLQQQPELMTSLRKLIRDGTQPDVATYFRLHSAGLACRRHDRIVPANQLYAEFFGQVQ